MKPPGLWLSTDPDMATLRLNYKEKTEKNRKVFELLEIPVRFTLLGKITVSNVLKSLAASQLVYFKSLVYCPSCSRKTEL